MNEKIQEMEEISNVCMIGISGGKHRENRKNNI